MEDHSDVYLYRNMTTCYYVKMQLLSRLKSRQILVLGSSRSGTTWLSEVINNKSHYRIIFEPVRKKITLKNCPFDDISGLPKTALQKERYKRFYDLIFAGKIKSHWTDSWSPIRFSRRKIIKEVRANLTLNWFSKTYPNLKIVFLIRNPFAVTVSRLNTNGGWDKYFLRERRIINKTKFFSHKQILAINRKRLYPEEQYFMSWCMENIVPLRVLPNNSNVHIVFYEDLLREPKNTFNSLFNFLDEEIDQDFWRIIKKPSRSSRRKKQRGSSEYIDGWSQELKPAVSRRLQKLANLFEVDKLYPDGKTPDKKGFDNLKQEA